MVVGCVRYLEMLAGGDVAVALQGPAEGRVRGHELSLSGWSDLPPSSTNIITYLPIHT